MVESQVPARSAFGWAALLRVTALANLAALAALALFEDDRLAAALAVIVLLGLTLRHTRFRLLGSLVLLILLADQSLYTAVATFNGVMHGTGVAATLMPALIAATALTGVIAAIGTLWRRHDPMAGQGRAPWVALTVGVLCLGLLGASAVTARQAPATAAPSDLSLDTANMAYSHSDLVVRSGTVTLEMSNRDLFWHTFTVDELGVDLLVAENDTKQTTFDAPPGIYEFYCAIPGHTALGMKGTLVVEDAAP